MNYFNTTQEAPKQVTIFEEINERQDDHILNIIKHLSNTSELFSSRDIENYDSKLLYGSIKRSLNTHVKLGNIVFTGGKVKSNRGRSESQYRLA